MTAAARKAFDDAVALEQSGNLDKALVSYLKAQELAPQDTEIAYRTASALLQAGYLEEAQSQLRRIVFAEPEHLGARGSLGSCQLLQGDLENAQQNFRDVLEQAQDNRNALFGLATVLLKEGRAAEAEGLARKLVELLPDTPAVLTLFAETQDKTGHIPASIAAYRKALKVDPEHVPALIGLSETLLLRKRYDEVIELAVRASQLSKTDAYPLSVLSDALSGKGALEDAREASEAALDLDPHSFPVMVQLSVLSRKLGDPVAALRYALAAHDEDTDAAEPLNALGSALASLKYATEARSVLTGHASNKQLEPGVRQLIEALIAEKVVPETSRENSATQSGLPSKSVDMSRDTPQNSETSRLNPVGDGMPNVLGLNRQDRS
ncbi:tetratricopeptide repeat protein [uncultured Roseibium sp.]|uniref:tetratricopeptide repeat protein n=1 Tax=uncultured Roseibium sp. TaxID=1936171 RepID=UPI0026214B27|nr:tetratricopeptide repeat protein [uncultured Roseibium sp.]